MVALTVPLKAALMEPKKAVPKAVPLVYKLVCQMGNKMVVPLAAAMAALKVVLMAAPTVHQTAAPRAVP